MEYKFIVTCKIKGIGQTVSFSRESGCESQFLLDNVKAALMVIEKKVEEHFGEEGGDDLSQTEPGLVMNCHELPTKERLLEGEQ